MEGEKLDKNDRAVQLFLNGQFKKMRDNLGKGSKLKKTETSYMEMCDSMATDYNNRPPTSMVKKNNCNKRRLAQIADQE